MKLNLDRARPNSCRRPAQFDRERVATGYSIDSRTLQPGELFFAVRGERLDGHDFVDAALAKGAVGAVVAENQAGAICREEQPSGRERYIVALQQFGRGGAPALGQATDWRYRFGRQDDYQGSDRARAGDPACVLKSHGNLNNHFGLPLQLLKLEPEHDIAVIEMGMSHAGEITRWPSWRSRIAAW